MKNLLRVMLVVFVCGFTSCKDDAQYNLDNPVSEIKDVDLAKNYLNFFRAKKSEGSILIQSTTSRAMQNAYRNVTFAERTVTDDESKKSNKRIEIKGFEKAVLKNVKNAKEDTNNLFGRVLSYRVVDGSRASETPEEVIGYNEIYVPELLDVNFNTEGLQPGTVITWNVDELNQNGVVISVEYYAINQLDTKLAFDNTTTIKKSFVLEDSQGSYTVTQEDLEIFPAKSLLEINVLRAGFDTDEDSDISIAGLTKVGDAKFVDY